MTQTARDLESTFARAWVLLSKNWVLIIPGILFGVLSAVAQFLVVVIALGTLVISGNGTADAAFAARILIVIITFLIYIAFALAQMTFVTGMAGNAWQHGTTSLRDGWEALSHRLWPIVAAGSLLFLIGLCATVLPTVTFLIPLLVYAVFFIYTMASVIIGGRGSVDAIAESCRVALGNLWPTLAVVLIVAAIALGGYAVGNALARVSEFAGWLVAGLLQQVIVAYASLVIAGEYLKLTGQPTT